MKLVSGWTLREVLRNLARGRREAEAEYSLHKLITVLERLCETMHFAHERGVLHRDLKPENVMLGEYGEVQVMDWGLAQLGEMEEGEAEVRTARNQAGLETPQGAMSGTAAYMSPEQMRGEALDRRSDVYALGCILYEMLTRRPAFDAQDRDLLSKKQSGESPALGSTGAGPAAPELLELICKKAMGRDRTSRYGSAGEMAQELRRWLDGSASRERRHAEAERLAAEGREAAARYLRLRRERDDAERAAEAEAAKHEPFQPLAEKRSLLEARSEAERAKTSAALAFAESTQLLAAALTQERRNATARAALAELWMARLKEAELLRETTGAAYALGMVHRFDDGRLAAQLEETGRLSIESDPSGAEILISRYADRDGLREPSEERRLGTTPLGPLALPIGSYLCVLRLQGFRDTRYPVLISRGKTWEGRVRLRTDAEIGEGFVYVPQGAFFYGEGRDTRIRAADDFAIGEYPVTRAEYAEFLTSLDPAEAEACMPRNEIDGDLFERGGNGVFRPINRVAGRALAWSIRKYGEGFVGRLPATCLSWDEARAYCQWKSGRTDASPWRLPTEEEREKAARGVDGRTFPWGDLEDASLAKCRDSREVNPQPEPVGAFETAQSVYGMRDAAGGVWDWTDSWFDEGRRLRALRGGGWFNAPRVLRAAYRHWRQPSVRDTDVGFRCARSLP